MSQCSYCNYELCGCGKCHTGGCKVSVKKPCTDPPRTQKGLGLKALESAGFWGDVLKVYVISHKKEDLIHATYPCFARPCPSSPKHGYIDSRVVESVKEAETLLDQVLADDPGGEIILCPLIEADYNMIWTPSSLVIGKGHDGATAGKNTLTIPLSGVMPALLTENILKQALIGPDQDPYVEIVMRTGVKLSDWQTIQFALTQLRAGPKIESGGDYIPKSVVVEKIITADAKKFKDRDWEKLIDSEAGNPGVVVWHPGGARTDHFSIHAFTHQIPVIFSKKPAIGDVLEPIAGESAGLDPVAMLKGVMVGDVIKLPHGDKNIPSEVWRYVDAMLVSLHNATKMTGDDSKWLGFAAAIMLRVGSTALAGEARHFKFRNDEKPAREAIYSKALKFSLSRHRAQVEPHVNIFRYGDWKGGGFGGQKWAACGAATVTLFEAVRQLALKQDEPSAAALVRALNLAVNQAHNGGWWLNKFVSQDAFNVIQAGSIPDIAKTAPAFYIGGKVYSAITEQKFTEWKKKIARWGRVTCHPPVVRDVQLFYQPGINSIGLTFKSKLLDKGGIRSIVAKLKNIEKIIPYIQDHSFLLFKDEGFAIEVRPPGQAPIVVWEEEPLTLTAEKQAGVLK